MLAVFTNSEGLVLVAERADASGSWQFPQGGIDPGESPEDAVAREMMEELGCAAFTVVGRSEGPVRYHFPPEMKGGIAKDFRGQDQIWFHLRFEAGQGPDLARATDKEFVATAWVTPGEAVRRAVSFKKDAYRIGLAALGIAFDEAGR